ncbi:MAG: hypothetical protein LQ351_004070 [Letrouitia transgressa]|nr:MAG: hypothetical protein LQ351_004070 [Letrouitia transgressa]
MKQWAVDEHERFSFATESPQSRGFSSLKFTDQAPIPSLGDTDVLVHFKYASLNYRDIVIPQGTYPSGNRANVVPGSDGAGIVEATGSRVKRFRKGDRVITLFNQTHIAGPLTTQDRRNGLGNSIDGTMREYGAFSEQGLVKMPESLDFRQACTLSCAGVTAWNALYGLEGRTLKPGDEVLVQGTGGVTLFALQFAKAAGARIIATTSSDTKADFLRNLGASKVINYKDNPYWGEEVKSLSAQGIGVDRVIEVGGPETMVQSIRATKSEGLISIVGYLSGCGRDKEASFLDCLEYGCTVRGILVGSRTLLEQLVKAVDSCKIEPVLDEKVFALEQLKEAMQYMSERKNFGKVTIKIS